MRILATKEEILEKIREKNCEWFEVGMYLTGTHEKLDYINQRTGESISDKEYWGNRYNSDDHVEFLQMESEDDLLEASVEIVEDRNDGDGNDAYKTIWFSKYDLYVSLTGTYSSWDRTTYEKVFQSKPYEYKETRFEQV